MTTRTTKRRGGRGRCAACESDQQEAINRDLAREVPYRVLEKRYGISLAALYFHKQNHLSPALAALRKERAKSGNEASAKTIVDELDDMLAMQDRLLVAATKTHNIAQVLATQRERRQTLELKAKLTGELDERPQVTVNLQQSQEFLQVQTIILEVLEPYPEAKEELAARLAVLEGGVG